MKISSMFHVLALSVTVLVFSTPFASVAQQNSMVLEARSLAKQDAESVVNKGIWFGAGGFILGGTLIFFRIIENPTEKMVGAACLLHGVALAGAFAYSPAPPPSRLLGKSAEYITIYTDAYKAEARKIRALWGIAGYISGGLVTGGILFLEP